MTSLISLQPGENKKMEKKVTKFINKKITVREGRGGEKEREEEGGRRVTISVKKNYRERRE